MRHSDEQLAAAGDLLADGLSRADAAQAIADQFGVSLRTAYRVIAAVSHDMSDTDGPCDTGDTGQRDYLALALQAIARSLAAAELAGDAAAVSQRAEALAGIVAKTKVRYAP
jgi:predicted DNA-binding transcriptional regulator YafY